MRLCIFNIDHGERSIIGVAGIRTFGNTRVAVQVVIALIGCGSGRGVARAGAHGGEAAARDGGIGFRQCCGSRRNSPKAQRQLYGLHGFAALRGHLKIAR